MVKSLSVERLKISLTNVCNLGCEHCYLNEQSKTFLDKDFVIQLLHEGSNAGVKIVDFTGGEPTMHPFFEMFLFVAHELNYDINVSTNGLNLSQNSILSAVKQTKSCCHISLDAIGDDKLSVIRGKGVFSRLNQLFCLLKENNICFSLRFSLNKYNFMDVASMIEFADHLGVNVSLGATQLRGHARDDMILSNEDFMWVREQINLIKCKTDIKIEECFTCYCPCDGAMMSILSINHYGQPVNCLMMSDGCSDSSNSASHPIHLEDLFHNALPAKCRLAQFRMFDKCQLCRFRSLCESGCLVTAKTMGCLD